MTQPWLDDAIAPTTCSQPSSSNRVFSQSKPHSSSRRNGSNVSQLLAWREISPQTKQLSKSLWGETSKWRAACSGPRSKITDARRSLVSWVEAESLRHLSAKYCPLLPPPRSTIAAAFSSDGKTLASTHGDHTVKIIDCQTGNCLKLFCGHRRTPWVVRFHPLYPEIFASGSLDHEVRLWDANTGDCIGSRDFYRPIASIAFHAQGEFLAVASGHKLYIWNYNRRGEAPTILLKTRRSLRAVHFHPHGAPFLLTAEVNDLDSPDSPLTLATSPGYLQYPPTAMFFANNHSTADPHADNKVPHVPSTCLVWPAFVREERRTSLHNENRTTGSGNRQQGSESSLPNQRQTYSTVQRQYDNAATHMEMSPGETSGSNSVPEDTVTNSLLADMETTNSDCLVDTLETIERQSTSGIPQVNSQGIFEKSDDANNEPSPAFQYDGESVQIPFRQSRLGAEACWELPFLQGWLMGQTHAGLHSIPPINNSLQGNTEFLPSRNMEALLASSSRAPSFGHSRSIGRSGTRHRSRSQPMGPLGLGEGAAHLHVQNDNSDSQSGASNIDSEVAASVAAAAAAELPCTVKLRIWPHDIQNPCAPLDAETCRLTIPHAVLCSEMGAHFSPCGRFLAACVACMLPHMEVDSGLQSQMQHDVSGIATSPTRHPISAHQVMYELRIYSLEEATFGLVLASRAIRAAHCLTSIQFSPTSEHILLAYGRRHSSLLRNIVIDGETTIPIYTILEVYRVSDMELVRVLPSAEDEVNVACFHPLVGGGLVYGTKEGKLRILQYDGSHGTACTGPNFSLEEQMLEVQKYALEC